MTNQCGYCTETGTPMVGSKYCDNKCQHNKGFFKFLFWKFVCCNYVN